MPSHLDNHVVFFLKSVDLDSLRDAIKYELRFTVSEDVMKKYQEVQNLLSGKYPKEIRMETLLDEVLEVFLERKSPKRRQERRVKR